MPTGYKCTQEEVIKRFREVHGDRYDYSKVGYKNMRSKVAVVCKTHGDFEISPHHHARGVGCPYCAGKRHTVEDRIARAKEVHGNKFTYLPFDFKNGSSIMNIICPVHGLFHRTVQQHLNDKNGCPYCHKSAKMNNQDFLKKAIRRHGDKYEYLEPYTKSDKNIKVRCKKHDFIFSIKPRDHIRGHGCYWCGLERMKSAQRLTLEEFIERANNIHNNKYDYSEVEYVNGNSVISITCPVHGPFRQVAEYHLAGQGCPICKESYGERNIDKWLTANNILFVRQFNIIPDQLSLIGRNKFIVDFFLPNHNIIIEFHGEQHFHKNKFFHKDNTEFQLQQDRDKRLREHCKHNKINLIEIPYTDIDKIPQILKRKIK